MSTDAGRGGAGGGAGGKGGVIAQAAQRTMSPLTRQALRAGKGKGSLAERTAKLQAATLAKAGVKVKAKGGKAASSITSGTMARHVKSLTAAGTDIPAFKQALATLKSDKGVDKAAMVAIANAYQNAPTGGTFNFKFKTKAAAADSIWSTFMGRAEGESRLNYIDRSR